MYNAYNMVKIVFNAAPPILLHLSRPCAGLEIRQQILDDAKAARWYSVMADECTDTPSHEQMEICIRFADESTCTSPEIREEFLGFVELERTDAGHVTQAILSFFV